MSDSEYSDNDNNNDNGNISDDEQMNIQDMINDIVDNMIHEYDNEHIPDVQMEQDVNNDEETDDDEETADDGVNEENNVQNVVDFNNVMQILNNHVENNPHDIPRLIIKNYFTDQLQNHFIINDISIDNNKMKLTLTQIYNLYYIKTKNRQINKNWFLSDEIIQTHYTTDSNDLSSYIVQIISENSINLNMILDSVFTEQTDKNKIIQIGNYIQEWINIMEYTDGGYHLNLDKISDFNSLILWIFIMCCDIKFIPIILDSHLSNSNIFSLEFLQRKANNISIMMMSIWNKQIRDIIIKNIGKTLYTTLLNEKINISTQHQHLNEISLIDMSIFLNTFYDMLRDDIIDYDVINYKENNTITHMLFESMNPYFLSLRTSNNIFKNLSTYDTHKLEYLPDNIKNKIKLEKTKQNDKQITPLTSLLYGFDYNIHEHINYKSFILEYVDIYNLDDITQITLNKYNPTEILLILENKYLKNILDFTNLTDDIVLHYYNYFIDYAWMYLTENKVINKQIINDLCKFLATKNNYLNIYLDNEMKINLQEINNKDISSLIFSIYIITNKNILDDSTYNMVNNYIKFLETNKNNFILLISKLLLQLESVFFKFTDLNRNIYDIYLELQLETKFSNLYLDYFNKFYDLDDNKNDTSLIIINKLCTHHDIADIDNLQTTILKYIDYIVLNLTSDQFIKIITNFTNLRNLLLNNDNIKNDIKFGTDKDTSEQIFTILELLDDNYDYVLNNVSEYKNNNYLRLIECITNITVKSDFKNFCNMFEINNEFINKYNIINTYIENILINSTNYDNLTYFLNIFQVNKTDISDEQIQQLINKNIITSQYIIGYFAYNGFLSDEQILSTFDKLIIPTNIVNKYEYFINIIKHYTNNNIIKKCINEIFKNELAYEKINEILDTYNDIQNYILDIDINNNIIYLIKYFSKKNQFITSQLISSYNITFLESNNISIEDKLDILINIHDLIEARIPCIFINNLKKNTKNLTDNNINKFAKLCDIYNEPISDNLITLYPELIHYTKNRQIIDKIINESLNSYDLFVKIINSNKRTNSFERKILKLTKEKDISLYIECLIIFNMKLTKTDKKLILENIVLDKNILKYVLDNNEIKSQIFESDKQIIYLMDSNSDFMISQLDTTYMLLHIENYKLSDLLAKNKVNNPRIFKFLSDGMIIDKLIELHGMKSFESIYDRNGRHIYDYMITHGKINNIPNDYLINENHIINTIKLIDTKYLIKIFDEFDNNKFSKLIETKDTDGNNLIYYIIKYHEKIFKSYIKDQRINKNMFQSNYNNETLLMKLIKESQSNDFELLIKWIVNNFELSSYDYYVSNYDGSVLSYCLKYNHDLIKIFQKNDIFKSVFDVYDTYDFICPYADNAYEKNIKMNILYIACITNHKLLDMLLRVDKRTTTKLIKEKIKTLNCEHTLLSIALFNNPDSVQVLLGFIDNDKYIQETEEIIGGFEKIIDVQPASWYYLQQYYNSRHTYKLKLDLDSHWYGYNYKHHMTSDNIKNVTHYILDKQEIGYNNNTCNICDTYKHKVIFTKCRHKVCIVCALRTDKCGNCRIKINNSDKILI